MYHLQKNITINELKKIVFELTSIEEDEQQLVITINGTKVDKNFSIERFF
jgi:hypothetical protein